MRIAIDFDGTIANTNLLHVPFCKRQFGIDIPLEATVSPGREQYLTPEQIDKVRRFVNGEGMVDAQLVPGVREALQLLAAARHKIVILTARPSYGISSAKEYLKKNDIPYHRFLYVSESEKRQLADGRILTKKLILDELKFDAMIEDQVKGLQGLSERTLGVLLDQPWNQGQQLPVGAIRAKNWKAIVSLLLQKAAA